MKPKNLLPLLAAGILCPAAAYSAEVANAAADFVQGANIGDPTTATGWTYLASDTATDVATGSNQLIWEAQVGNVGATEGYGVGPTTGNLDLPAVVGTNDNGGDYEIFADGADANGNANAYGGHGAVVGTDLLLHPSNQANELYLVLRYTIQPGDLADGTTAIIAGSFRDLSGFDTTNSGLNANQMRQAGSIHAQVFYNSTQLWEASGADGTLTQANGTFNLTQTGVSVGETISFVIDRNPLGDTNGGTQNGERSDSDDQLWFGHRGFSDLLFDVGPA